MRSSLFILITLISYIVAGQKVEFRNDSLLINNHFVDTSTSQSTLDNLLKSSGKTRRRLIKSRSVTKERMYSTTITYKKLGLIFGRNDYGSARLSLAVKLYRNSNPNVDQNNMATEAFTGDLYIAGNYMNDKKTIEQLQKLENCVFSYRQATTKFNGNPVYLTQGNINYNNRSISLMFDGKTNTVTCLFIK